MRKTKIGAVLTAAVLVLSCAACAPGGTKIAGNGTKMLPKWKMENFAAGSSPNALTPAQVRKAYDADGTFGTGKGKKIALVVAYGSPTLQGDLDAFDAAFGLKKPNLEIHDCGVQTQNSDWAVETSLDTEWAHVMAPDADLLVVEAASDNSEALLDAIDYAAASGAQAVSISWGTAERPSLTMADSHFSGNTVYVAAAGDDGSGAIWPASSPNVVAVGGTTLKLDKNGNRLSEKAWRYSGGGPSLLEAAPSWQTEMGIESVTRSTPDVSFDAGTGVCVYYGGGTGTDHWYSVGGTSVGAPAWAGIVADLNENADSIKNAGSLYVLAGTAGYQDPGGCFFDITSGSNGWRAAAGYDEASGLGTPNCAELNRQAAADAAALSQVKNEQDSLPASLQISVIYFRRGR